MIGRPNLPRLHCEKFRILFHVELAESLGNQALSESLSYTDDEAHEVTFYGKSYRYGEVAHVIDARIFLHNTNNYHVSLSFAREDRGKPPEDIKPPDQLMNLILNNAPPDPVSINAYGTFKYDSAEGWQSFFPLELPAPVQVARGISFTHVGGMQLSNVVDNRTRDWAGVTSSEEGIFVVELGIRRERLINKGLVRTLMRDGLRLASTFVRQQVISDGN